jgi:two-component system, cell cycle sensor histidine kinase and response regulator CckA
MLRRLIGEDIELEISLAADIGNIKADAGQVEQVVMNLVINARDAMPNGGKIHIKTSRSFVDPIPPELSSLIPGTYVVLAVEDTGLGMSEEVKAHIFEPFFTTKEPGKGTGLGLATVYGIVHQSGGDIEVESAPGKGTTFRVYLPSVQQKVPAEKTEALQSPQRGREVILVVEDEESLRKLMGHALRQQGYTVLEAKEGAEALQVAKEHEGEIHMLVTDVVMPGIRGWELARRITAMLPRVLYVSGYADHVALEPTVLGKRAAFLQKPFTPSTLAQKVRSFLENAEEVRGQP